MTTRPTVLVATPADQDDALRLLGEMERHYEGADAVPTARAAEAVKILLAAGRPWLGMLLARSGDEAVGFATFSVVLPTEAFRPGLFVKDIFVAASARRQGVGWALLRRLAEEAQHHGCVRIDWSTDVENAAACALYDEVGATRLQASVHFRLDADAIARLASGADR
jgi:ribosomal protein S18 acetylase RimI-like enzyme